MLDTIQPDKNSKTQDTPSCFIESHRGFPSRVCTRSSSGSFGSEGGRTGVGHAPSSAPATVAEMGPHRPSQLLGDCLGRIVR